MALKESILNEVQPVNIGVKKMTIRRWQGIALRTAVKFDGEELQ